MRPGFAPPWLDPNILSFRQGLRLLEGFLPICCDFPSRQLTLYEPNVFSYLQSPRSLSPGEEAGLPRGGDPRSAPRRLGAGRVAAV